MALLSLKVTTSVTPAGGSTPATTTVKSAAVTIPAAITLGIKQNFVLGPPGVGPQWKGIWSGATTYAQGDGVTGSNGHNYISLVAGNLNHDPTTDGGVRWTDTLPFSVVTGSPLRGSAGYDPTGVVASDAALQTALNAASAYVEPKVVIPAGDICKLSTGGITIPAGVELVVDGRIDASSCPANTTVLQSVGSTTGSALNLAANCPVGQAWCQVSGTAPADKTICLLYSNAMWVSCFAGSVGGNQQLGEYVVARLPTATLNTTVTSGDTTIILDNLGDIFRSHFWPGCPILIGSEQITFTGVSMAATTITLNGCTRGANSTVAAGHTSGAAVSLPSGYVAFEGPCLARPGGAYNTADSAALQACAFNDAPAITGTGRITGGGYASGMIGILFDRCRRVRMSSALLIEEMGSVSVQMFDVIESVIDGPTTMISQSNPPAGNQHGAQGYGIAFFCACQDVTIVGGVFHGGKHAMTGGNTFTRPGIIRRCGSIGAKAVSQTVAGFDWHSGAEQVFHRDATIVGSLGSGFGIRCPSGRFSGSIKQCAWGVQLANQSDVPSDYDVDVDIQDVASGGVSYQPNTNFNTKVTGSLTAGFTGNVPVSSGTTGFAASGYLMLEDTIDSVTGLAEIVHYTSLDAVSFTVDARGALGTPALAHSAGATIEQANTGIGAKTNKLRIRASIDRLTAGALGGGGPSVLVQTYDNIRITGLDLDVTVRDPGYAFPRIQLQACDRSFVKTRMGGLTANAKAIQIIGCINGRIDPVVDYASLGTGIAVSLESATAGMQIIAPVVSNAATGVQADSTCTNCTVIAGTGLAGATTPLSLPSGKGHYTNQNAQYQLFTANGTFTVPPLITTVWLRAVSGGGGGGGGGSSTVATLQTGGSGGPAGTVIEGWFPVNPGDVLTFAKGTGGTSGLAGVAGGNNAGGGGGAGGASTWTNTTQSKTLINTGISGHGNGSAGNSTTNVASQCYAAPGTTAQLPLNTIWPGTGGASTVASAGPVSGVVVGGGGGAAANATNGGTGGGAQLSSAVVAQQAAGTAGGSGTAAGGNGVTATQPGCGGGGGGGGNNNLAGGAGGAGADGFGEVRC